MRALAFGAVLLLSAGGAASQPSEFRDSRLATIDDPLRVEFGAAGAPVEAAQLAQKIRIVVLAADWKILAEGPGRLDLGRTVREKHVVKVALVYDARGFTIRYLDSASMLYSEDAQTLRGAKARAVHKNYNVWIRQLASSVNAGLGLPPASYRASATPLPAEVKVEPPGPTVPAAIAAYSGAWVGKWGGRLDHTLVVESIEGNDVTFIYSFNPAQFSNSSAPGWRRVRGTIDSRGALLGLMGSGADPVNVSYRFSEDGSKLLGEYYRQGRVTHGVFERGELPSASTHEVPLAIAALDPAPDVALADPQPEQKELAAAPRLQATVRNIVLRFSGTSVAMDSPDWDRLKAEWYKAMSEAASRSTARFSVLEGERRQAGTPGTLVDVYVNRFRFVAPGARFVAGIMTGNAHMEVTVTLVDLESGATLGTRTYKTTSRGRDGIFASVTDKQVRAVADQIATEVAATGTLYGKAR